MERFRENDTPYGEGVLGLCNGYGKILFDSPV